jgi:V/A-type H+-transporting ATPase subunit B
MGIDISMSLEDALDLCWKTMAECFAPEDLLMKQHLIEKYYPRTDATAGGVEAA